mmetsp:Transcript_29796/g.74966  ORF Transcript_29796/g.74966 Transcript_29796/m.74966 type:complete len:331 (-) Transcript_29796:2241-3233(-)
MLTYLRVRCARVFAHTWVCGLHEQPHPSVAEPEADAGRPITRTRVCGLDKQPHPSASRSVAELEADVGRLDVLVVGVCGADLEDEELLLGGQLHLGDAAGELRHGHGEALLELLLGGHKGAEEDRNAARDHRDLERVLGLEVLEKLFERHIPLVNVDPAPEGPLNVLVLSRGRLYRLREGAEGEGEVGEGVLVLVDLLVLAELVELDADKACDHGGCGGDGGDDLAGDELCLMPVRGLNRVVARAEVRTRGDVVHVEVVVVVLLKLDGVRPKGSKARRGGQLRGEALHVVVVHVAARGVGGVGGLALRHLDLYAFLGSELGDHDVSNRRF